MIGKWHISEEHKRFCELASGLGKICCFQEREGGMQSPLCRETGLGAALVLRRGRAPAAAPGPLQAGSAGSGRSCRALGLPKLFGVSPDIYYTFCLGFIFFFLQSRKFLDAVREGWEGRCPWGSCALQPWLLVLARSGPTGAESPPGLPLELFPMSVGPSLLAGAWRQKGQDPPVTEFTCCSLEPFAALTSDVSSMIYAPVWTLLYIRVGVLHSHLLSIFLCALSDGFADCISIVFISMQVFKQYLTTVFLKLHKG